MLRNVSKANGDYKFVVPGLGYDMVKEVSKRCDTSPNCVPDGTIGCISKGSGGSWEVALQCSSLYCTTVYCKDRRNSKAI